MNKIFKKEYENNLRKIKLIEKKKKIKKDNIGFYLKKNKSS